MSNWALTIDGTSQSILQGTFSISLALSGVSSTSFTITVASSAALPKLGHVVVVTDPDSNTVFGGFLVRRTVGIPQGALATDATRFVKCACRGYDSLAMRRYVWLKASDQATGTTAGELVDYVEAYHAEGMTQTGITTGIILEGDLFFDGVRLADALDFLVLHTPDHVWGIDTAKDVFFKPRDTDAAPFDITAADTDDVLDGSLEATVSMERYRNVQYVAGAAGGLGPTIKEEIGAVENQDYIELRHMISGGPDTDNAPKVWRDTVAQTVGREGDPVGVGSDIFFERGSRTLRFDSAEEAGGGDWEVEYQPTYRMVGYAEEPDGIAIYGRYEHQYVNESIRTEWEAQSVAEALLRRSAIKVDIEYKTMVHGLQPGQEQTVNLPAYDINSDTEVLITAVNGASAGGQVVYSVRATSGQRVDSDDDYLRALLQRTDRLETGEGEKLDRFEFEQDNAEAAVTAVLALV